jgi:hypothetical protein
VAGHEDAFVWEAASVSAEVIGDAGQRRDVGHRLIVGSCQGGSVQAADAGENFVDQVGDGFPERVILDVEEGT